MVSVVKVCDKTVEECVPAQVIQQLVCSITTDGVFTASIQIEANDSTFIGWTWTLKKDGLTWATQAFADDTINEFDFGIIGEFLLGAGQYDLCLSYLSECDGVESELTAECRFEFEEPVCDCSNVFLANVDFANGGGGETCEAPTVSELSCSVSGSSVSVSGGVVSDPTGSATGPQTWILTEGGSTVMSGSGVPNSLDGLPEGDYVLSITLPYDCEGIDSVIVTCDFPVEDVCQVPTISPLTCSVSGTSVSISGGIVSDPSSAVTGVSWQLIGVGNPNPTGSGVPTGFSDLDPGNYTLLVTVNHTCSEGALITGLCSFDIIEDAIFVTAVSGTNKDGNPITATSSPQGDVIPGSSSGDTQWLCEGEWVPLQLNGEWWIRNLQSGVELPVGSSSTSLTFATLQNANFSWGPDGSETYLLIEQGSGDFAQVVATGKDGTTAFETALPTSLPGPNNGFPITPNSYSMGLCSGDDIQYVIYGACIDSATGLSCTSSTPSGNRVDDRFIQPINPDTGALLPGGFWVSDVPGLPSVAGDNMCFPGDGTFAGSGYMTELTDGTVWLIPWDGSGATQIEPSGANWSHQSAAVGNFYMVGHSTTGEIVLSTVGSDGALTTQCTVSQSEILSLFSDPSVTFATYTHGDLFVDPATGNVCGTFSANGEDFSVSPPVIRETAIGVIKFDSSGGCSVSCAVNGLSPAMGGITSSYTPNAQFNDAGELVLCYKDGTSVFCSVVEPDVVTLPPGNVVPDNVSVAPGDSFLDVLANDNCSPAATVVSATIISPANPCSVASIAAGGSGVDLQLDPCDIGPVIIQYVVNDPGTNKSLATTTATITPVIPADHVFVDSVTGNDGSSGLTPATAKRTPQAGFNVTPAGGTLWLKSGSVWQGIDARLLIEDKAGVTIDCCGCGPCPVFDGLAPADTTTPMPANAEPNSFSANLGLITISRAPNTSLSCVDVRNSRRSGIAIVQDSHGSTLCDFRVSHTHNYGIFVSGQDKVQNAPVNRIQNVLVKDGIVDHACLGNDRITTGFETGEGAAMFYAESCQFDQIEVVRSHKETSNMKSCISCSITNSFMHDMDQSSRYYTSLNIGVGIYVEATSRGGSNNTVSGNIVQRCRNGVYVSDEINDVTIGQTNTTVVDNLLESDLTSAYRVGHNSSGSGPLTNTVAHHNTIVRTHSNIGAVRVEQTANSTIADFAGFVFEDNLVLTDFTTISGPVSDTVGLTNPPHTISSNSYWNAASSTGQPGVDNDWIDGMVTGNPDLETHVFSNFWTRETRCPNRSIPQTDYWVGPSSAMTGDPGTRITP